MGRAGQAEVVQTLPRGLDQSDAEFQVELKTSVSKCYRDGPKYTPSLVPLTSRVAGLHMVD